MKKMNEFTDAQIRENIAVLKSELAIKDGSPKKHLREMKAHFELELTTREANARDDVPPLEFEGDGRSCSSPSRRQQALRLLKKIKDREGELAGDEGQLTELYEHLRESRADRRVLIQNITAHHRQIESFQTCLDQYQPELEELRKEQREQVDKEREARAECKRQGLKPVSEMNASERAELAERGAEHAED